ncbi:hypothetical protein BVC80_1321g35 [Macleaya cordata]|uniref:Uncharacterized protein n=1 Tax=Macleaya cordata TaxID=56857 RepID=A0A200Q0A5_MACCD|nr:hypothetical protein BVC80_1321g35 [Macleaya cordata]
MGSLVLPSLFHFLVSSSPVLVCTAVLLGTILSFGDQNYIPEFELEEEEKVEEEEKKSKNTPHENSSLLAGEIVQNNLVIEKDESFSVETHAENRRETDELAIEDEEEWVFIATEGDKLISDGTVLTSEETKEIHDKKQEIQEEKELHDLVLIEDREFSEKKLLFGGGVSGACENDIEVQSSEGGKKKNEDLEVVGFFNSSQDSPSWNEIERSDQFSDSSNNQKGSSSSDPYMEDLTTMLEELQPLLDAQPSQPALISLSHSDAESEQTVGTTDSSIDSEEEVEWKLVGREVGRNIIVTWTEEDEKNFMGDLQNADQESERISRIEQVGDHVEQESNSSEEVELVEIDQRKKIDIYSEVGRSISRLQAIQSSTTKHIDSDLRQFNEGEVERYSYLELIHGVSLLEETRVGPAEFKQLKNFNLAFKQPREGRVEKPVVLESICEKSIFEETKFGSPKFVLPDQDEVERPIVLKSINMGPNLEDTTVESTERWLSNEDHVILELPGLETRSPEHCVVGGHVKPSLAEAVDDEPRALECKYPVDTHSDFQVLEESSIGEIYLAPKEPSEGSTENIPKPSESEHGVEENYLAPKVHSEVNMENIIKSSESEHGVDEIYLTPEEHSEVSMENIHKPSESEHGVDEIYLTAKEHSEVSMKDIHKPSESENGVDEIVLTPKEHLECSMETIPKPSESEHEVDEVYLSPEEHSEGSLESIPKPSESERGVDEIYLAPKEHSEGLDNITEASESENGMDKILAKEVETVKEVESGFEESDTSGIGTSLEESNLGIKETH